MIERDIEVDGLTLHVRELGDGEPVLLLHGWPTSSFLWRNVMPSLAHRRVIAMDLPGFGASSKPLDASYSFRFFGRAIDGLLDALGVDRTALVVHDLGGPVGLYWASQQPERVTELGILNTLAYPELSWAVKAFVLMTHVPGLRSLVTSERGLKGALAFGLHDKTRLLDDAVEGTVAPFRDPASRQALLKAAQGMHPRGFDAIAAWLPTVTVPTSVIYGTRDRILPDIATTARRLAADIPHAEVVPLADCGHFLQEEQPEVVGRHLADLLSPARR